jgi:hypothetical protein
MDLIDDLDDIISTLDAKDFFPKFMSHDDKILWIVRALELELPTRWPTQEEQVDRYLKQIEKHGLSHIAHDGKGYKE